MTHNHFDMDTVIMISLDLLLPSPFKTILHIVTGLFFTFCAGPCCFLNSNLSTNILCECQTTKIRWLSHLWVIWTLGNPNRTQPLWLHSVVYYLLGSLYPRGSTVLWGIVTGNQAGYLGCCSLILRKVSHAGLNKWWRCGLLICPSLSTATPL